MGNPLWFNGRMRRWLFLPIMVALNAVSKILDRAAEDDPTSPIYWASLLLLWPAITTSVQRGHDSGRDGMFVAQSYGLMLVSGVLLRALLAVEERGIALNIVLIAACAGALAGVFMWLIVAFSPGQPGENAFGPDPRTGPHEQQPSEGEVEIGLTQVLTGTLVKEGPFFTLKSESGRGVRLDVGADAEQFLGQAVEVEGTRSAFDLLRVDRIVAIAD